MRDKRHLTPQSSQIFSQVSRGEDYSYQQEEEHKEYSYRSIVYEDNHRRHLKSDFSLPRLAHSSEKAQFEKLNEQLTVV